MLATASPRNHEYLRSLGADHVFDYRSDTALEDVRAAAGGDLRLAWDCHSDAVSAAFCGKALAPGAASHYSALLGGVAEVVQAVNEGARADSTLYYTGFGEPVMLGKRIEAIPENYEFGKMFWELSRKLLEEGKVRPVRVAVNRGGAGLEGVLMGLKESKEGKVSAEKLVYKL